MEKPLHTVGETNAFLTTAKRIGLSDDERAAIVNQVASAPQDGDLVQGSGGVRKIRSAGSSGYRVMVAYLGDESPAYLLGVLSKTARELHGCRGQCHVRSDQGFQASSEHGPETVTGEGAMENEAFETVMAGLHEALAHARGEAVPGLVVHPPRVRADLDVAAIRRRTGASQARFAQSIGIAVSTLRTWEQGRRHPEGPARVLLALLDRNPRVVEELLVGEG